MLARPLRPPAHSVPRPGAPTVLPEGPVPRQVGILLVAPAPAALVGCPGRGDVDVARGVRRPERCAAPPARLPNTARRAPPSPTCGACRERSSRRPIASHRTLAKPHDPTRTPWRAPQATGVSVMSWRPVARRRWQRRHRRHAAQSSFWVGGRPSDIRPPKWFRSLSVWAFTGTGRDPGRYPPSRARQPPRSLRLRVSGGGCPFGVPLCGSSPVEEVLERPSDAVAACCGRDGRQPALRATVPSTRRRRPRQRRVPRPLPRR